MSDAKQRDKTSRDGKCFPIELERKSPELLQQTKTPGTIAKPHLSVHLYESMRQWWLANPTMKLDKSSGLGGLFIVNFETWGTSPFVALISWQILRMG